MLSAARHVYGGRNQHDIEMDANVSNGRLTKVRGGQRDHSSGWSRLFVHVDFLLPDKFPLEFICQIPCSYPYKLKYAIGRNNLHARGKCNCFQILVYTISKLLRPPCLPAIFQISFTCQTQKKPSLLVGICKFSLVEDL